MKLYRTRVGKLPGTNYREVRDHALLFYKKIKSRSKRRPYVRSKYFGNEKVFLDLFWEHLRAKNLKDRARRLKFLPCAIEVIRKSQIEPRIKHHVGSDLYRFIGQTFEGEIFVVQIKKIRNKNRKLFISVFPR